MVMGWCVSTLMSLTRLFLCFFFFQAEDGIRDYKVTGVQTCALPILQFGLAARALFLFGQALGQANAFRFRHARSLTRYQAPRASSVIAGHCRPHSARMRSTWASSERSAIDRKSTRLNSSHLVISYAVFCLKNKKKDHTVRTLTNNVHLYNQHKTLLKIIIKNKSSRIFTHISKHTSDDYIPT